MTRSKLLAPKTIFFIDGYIDAALSFLKEQGVALEVNPDFQEFVGTYRALASEPALTTFDPEHSFLTPQNSLWLLGRSRGVPVCCIAVKMFSTPDLRNDLRTGRLFWDRTPLMERFLADGLNDELPEMRGRVAYVGGSYVNSSFRGKGLASCLSRTVKAIAVKHFLADWLCATYFEDGASSTRPLGGNGYAHMLPCVRTPLPETYRWKQFYLSWSSSQEFIGRLRLDGYYQKKAAAIIHVPGGPESPQRLKAVG